MTRRSLRALLCGALAFTLWFPTQTSSAQEAPRRPSLSESLPAAAKADYDAAKLLFEDGDFAGAASKFGQAYERAKDPRLLWNIAVCEKGLRHYVRVLTLVDRYLDEGKDILGPEQTRTANELRETVKGFVGTLRVDAEPGTEIAIDGAPPRTAPITDAIPLELGGHKLNAERPGSRPFAQTFEISGGKETSLKVVLRPLDPRARLSVQAGEGDSIAFDGRVVAVTRWQSEVQPGTHSLRVTAPRRKPYDARIDLLEGASRTVDVTLENESRALWPWIAGGVAVVAAASVGGYFLFRPDAKPAEQPSGTLGLVNLAGWSR